MLLSMFAKLAEKVCDHVAQTHTNLLLPHLSEKEREMKLDDMKNHIKSNFLDHFHASVAGYRAGDPDEREPTPPMHHVMIESAIHALRNHPEFHSHLSNHPVLGAEASGVRKFAAGIHYGNELHGLVADHFDKQGNKMFESHDIRKRELVKQVILEQLMTPETYAMRKSPNGKATKNTWF